MSITRQRQRTGPTAWPKPEAARLQLYSIQPMGRNIAWVSEARFAPYLDACAHDIDLAWELYEWNAQVASALSECFHHAEVLLRNSMMHELETLHPLEYPWQSEAVADRLTSAALKRRDGKTRVASPDSIIAELTLGFWVSLLEKSVENDELWRHCLRNAFPHSPGRRDVVLRAVSSMHRVRNRCAHQDSLLEVDPGIELKKLLTLVEWIDPDARRWVESIESVSKIAKARPVQPSADVVIVGASADQAIAMYEKVAAYVCPSDRTFATMTYMGFYADKQIKPYFPLIKDVVVPARWNRHELADLKASTDPTDQHVARAMGYALKNGWDTGDSYQVFLLTTIKDAQTLNRAGGTPIMHYKTGRGSAFVQNKRYLPHTALLAADDTDHLS